MICQTQLLRCSCTQSSLKNRYHNRSIMASVCNPGINPRIENPVKQPMATDQAECQRRSYPFGAVVAVWRSW